jgi:hypothetical protein
MLGSSGVLLSSSSFSRNSTQCHGQTRLIAGCGVEVAFGTATEEGTDPRRRWARPAAGQQTQEGEARLPGHLPRPGAVRCPLGGKTDPDIPILGSEGRIREAAIRSSLFLHCLIVVGIGWRLLVVKEVLRVERCGELVKWKRRLAEVKAIGKIVG